jgi:NADH-quinone oxidoreductase subunit E
MGGDLIFERLKDHLGVGNDETTDDGKITLEHVECNAACDYAPVVMVNWEFFDNQTPESAAALVDELMAGNEVRATRGARVCTWREAERVLAGFPDDRADEGPSAGPASLAGLRLARERDWRAPQPDRGAADGDVVAADQASKDASEEPDVAVAASPAGTRHEDQEQSRDADSRAETSNGSNRKTDS